MAVRALLTAKYGHASWCRARWCRKLGHIELVFPRKSCNPQLLRAPHLRAGGRSKSDSLRMVRIAESNVHPLLLVERRMSLSTLGTSLPHTEDVTSTKAPPLPPNLGCRLAQTQQTWCATKMAQELDPGTVPAANSSGPKLHP